MRRFSNIGIYAWGAALTLGACASVVEGTDQSVEITLAPEAATCQVVQKGKTLATLHGGTSSLDIPKSRDDIVFECAAKGYANQEIRIESSASGWGVAGCIVVAMCVTDYSTGALNKYPKSITINLKKDGASSAASD